MMKTKRIAPWMAKIVQVPGVGMVLEIRREKSMTQVKIPRSELPFSQAMRRLSSGRVLVRWKAIKSSTIETGRIQVPRTLSITQSTLVPIMLVQLSAEGLQEIWQASQRSGP